MLGGATSPLEQLQLSLEGIFRALRKRFSSYGSIRQANKVKSMQTLRGVRNSFPKARLLSNDPPTANNDGQQEPSNTLSRKTT